MQARRKGRIDELLVERGMAASLAHSRSVIMSGRVRVSGSVVSKAGTEIDTEADIEIADGSPYVGRGGVKLAGALESFGINPHGMCVMDIGASTGGFTDCLLKKGAVKVYAVDVGKGLLDWGLRNDKRVVVLEGKNIRHLQPDEVGGQADMVVIDVSFISLKAVLPKAAEFLKERGIILALIKPQFEAEREETRKGIVGDPAVHERVIAGIKEFAAGIGFIVHGVCESAIKGAKGNREFWIYLGDLHGR